MNDYKFRKYEKGIDVRINTCYNKFMIRKGDTKDAYESKGDDKAPEEKWFP